MISTHLWHLVPTLNNFKLPTLNNSSPPSRQFSRNKMLLKKFSSGKSLLNKLLNLKKGAWVVHIWLKLVIFRAKQKSSKANLRVQYLMLKMLQKAMYFDFPVLGRVTKFNPKMRDFKCVLDLT